MARRIRLTLSWLLLAGLLVPIASHQTAGANPPPTGDGSWRRLGPAHRCWGPSGIYDPIRQRMVVFGGVEEGAIVGNSMDVVWELSLTGTSSWTALTGLTDLSGGVPFGRQSHSAIYDPVRDRMIVFGGQGGNVYNDVWSLNLSLAGPPVWTQLSPAGLPPVARQGHTAIYDPIRDRMVVFGGNDSSNLDHNDVWALALSGSPAWTKLTPAGTPPPKRGWHSAIYDPVRDRMVVFAGYVWATNGWLGDTWTLDLSGTTAWSPLTASGSAPARNSHAAIYDPVADRMVVYGGYHDPGNPAALTVLSFAGSPAWSQITPSGGPTQPRDGATAIYDAQNQRMVVYGGIDGEFGKVWAVTLSGSPAWSALAPVGAPVGQRSSVVYDSSRDRLVMLAENFVVDTVRVWAQSLVDDSWSPIVPTGTPPPMRSGYSAIYDQARDRVVMFGGYGADPSEVWALNFSGGPAWSQIMPAGTAPPWRWYHTAILDPIRDRMVVYGGRGGLFNTQLDDVWALSLSIPGWTQLTPGSSGPGARLGHGAIYDFHRDRMVIVGGYDGDSIFRRDLWALDFATLAWLPITPAVSLPTPRAYMSAIYDPPRQRMLMFGGSNGSMTVNELWSLPLSGTPVWSELTPPGLVPFDRKELEAIYDPVRDRMVLYGGVYVSSGYNDTWAYSPGGTVAVPDLRNVGVGDLAFGLPRPNPSRDGTRLEFVIARPGAVTLDVFDARGRHVRKLIAKSMEAGSHSVAWDGADARGAMVRSGLYFARIRSGGAEATRRVVRAL